MNQFLSSKVCTTFAEEYNTNLFSLSIRYRVRVLTNTLSDRFLVIVTGVDMVNWETANLDLRSWMDPSI